MTAQRLPPPPARAQAPAATTTAQRPIAGDKPFSIETGRQAGAQRVLIYGQPGVGKTSLAALLPKPLFVDLERGSRSFDVARIAGIESFTDLRAALQSDVSGEFETVIIDSVTRAEELAVEHVVATVPHEKPGTRVTGLESYPFGKGFRFVFDTFGLLLQDLDQLVVRKGKTVVLIAHACTSPAPNPFGEDFLQYQPRLQAPRKEGNIRDRVIGWCDHALFLAFDVAAQDGKGIGSGSRSIHTTELPSHVAKTRGAADPSQQVPASLPYEQGDASIWRLLLGGAS